MARSVWTLGTIAGRTSTVQAWAVGLDTVMFQATTVVGGPSQFLVISGDSQAALIGAPLDSDVVFRVEDQFGNPVSASLVTFAITAGGGQVAPITISTDSDGLARATWKVGPNPGYDTLSATVSGLPVIRIGAEAHPAPPLDTSYGLGSTHTCRLDGMGQAFCWGLNFHGEVGSGDTLSAFTPRAVVTQARFAKIAAGPFHNCALTAQSGLYCWGTMGSTLLGLSPTAQVFPQTFNSIAAGTDFMCGLTGQGQAFCWGQNVAGQLGDGTTTPHPSPVPVSGAFRFRQISAGPGHACGLTTNGRVHCWGNSGPGPAALGELRFVGLAVGELGDCGLTLNGEAWCWNPGSPTLISSILHFSSLSVGGKASCAVTVAGVGFCWGMNDNGELGDGTLVSRTNPAPVQGGVVFSSIHVGADVHACGVTVNNELYCWGGGETVAMGVGENMRRRTPTPVLGGHQFTSLSAGDRFTCGIMVGGTALCWGLNATGELGDGTFEEQTLPAVVAGSYGFTQLSAGTTIACGVTSSAAAVCWGDNSSGQGGMGSTGPARSIPTPIGGGLAIGNITAGRLHACATTTTNTGYCWGDNTSGELGDSTTATRLSPVPVKSPDQWSIIRAGVQSSCGITTGGWGKCWGTQLALGNGGIDRNFPDSIRIGITLSDIATSGTISNACGIGSDLVAYCWGNGDVGQLGDGSVVGGVTTPVPVAGGHTFQEIGVGNGFACGLTGSGTLYCWGTNSGGQLGDGTLLQQTVPIAVSGGLLFSHLTVGSTHSCALNSSGTAFCWGDNYNGQLGIGVSAVFRTPVRVQ